MNYQVKKFNPLFYFLVHIAPAILGLLLLFGSFMITDTPYIGLVVTFSFMGYYYFKRAILKSFFSKKGQAALDAAGFTANQTFFASSSILYVDINKAQIAVLYYAYPTVQFFPASAMTNIMVNDYKSGSGFMEGSNRVSFEFMIGDTKMKFFTFTSNKRFKMDSNQILTGISKADSVVGMLDAAKAQSVA